MHAHVLTRDPLPLKIMEFSEDVFNRIDSSKAWRHVLC